MPILRHFFSRQCWHWFRWCWSTGQLRLPRHWYVKFLLTDRLKKLLQPKAAKNEISAHGSFEELRLKYLHKWIGHNVFLMIYHRTQHNWFLVHLQSWCLHLSWIELEQALWSCDSFQWGPLLVMWDHWYTIGVGEHGENGDGSYPWNGGGHEGVGWASTRSDSS